MYSSFSRLLDIVTVKESDTHIIVRGISGIRFSKDIYSQWKTNRITTNMFTAVGRSSVKFPKFFAIEVLYIIDELLKGRRCLTGRRTLQKVRTELLQSTWLKNLGNPTRRSLLDFKKLDDFNFKPLAHQMEFLKEYERRVNEYSLGGLLLDGSAGSGKTLSQFMLAHCLGTDTKILISPKNAVQDVWVATTNIAFKKGPPSHWHSLSGEDPVTGKEYYIVHYNYLEKFLEFVKANRRAFGSVYVGVDESHNFNETSSRTATLIELCAVLQAGHVLHASGTPFKAMGSESVTLLKTICNDFTDEVEAAFRKIFGKEAKRANEILANRIGIVSFKVTKAQVETPGVDNEPPVKVTLKNGNDYTLSSIREKMRAFIEERKAFYLKHMDEYVKLYNECLTLHEKTLKSSQDRSNFELYKKYVGIIKDGKTDPATMKDLIMFCNRYELKTLIPSLPQQYRKPFLNVRAIIKYVELKVMGEALGKVLGQMRVQCHLDMLPHMPLPEIIDNALSKTVIFSSYVEVVKEAEKLLTNAGYKPLVVYGDTNKNLSQILKKFGGDENINPLIATYQSLSTAVPLTMANTIIMTNSPFRNHERIQTIARIDRIGQEHRCKVYEVFLDTGDEGNISTRSKDILEWSKEQVEQIMGVQSPSDLEASLETLAESPDLDLSQAIDLFEMVKASLPVDVVDSEV